MTEITFQGRSGRVYGVRPATGDDHGKVAELIELDADHRGQVQAASFAPPMPVSGQECFAIVEPQSGELLFYFRITRVMRIDIQFDPRRREDNQQVLQDGFEWLVGMGMKSGYRQLIFDSVTRPLINFCKRRFRFRPSPNELVCEFPLPMSSQAGAAAVHPVQSNSNPTPQTGGKA